MTRTWSPRSSAWSERDDELVASPHAERGIPRPCELFRSDDVRLVPVHHHDVQSLDRRHEREVVRLYPAPGRHPPPACQRLPVRPERRRVRIPRSTVPRADDGDAQLPARDAWNPPDALPPNVLGDVRPRRDLLHGPAPRPRDRRLGPVHSRDAFPAHEHRRAVRSRAAVVPPRYVAEFLRLDGVHAKPRVIRRGGRGRFRPVPGLRSPPAKYDFMVSPEPRLPSTNYTHT